MRYPRVFFLLLVLISSLAFRVYFIANDMSALATQGPLYDDSFYCFAIARNIAEGNGSTFDGLHPTNGYQPLYVALLVPLYWLSGDNPNLPIYLALIFSAILNVVTGFILYKILRRFTGHTAALFGVVLWGFGPAIVRQSLNGLETSLAMFFIACSLYYYVAIFRRHASPGIRQMLTMSLLLVFAVLSRVDSLLFVLALATDGLLIAWRHRTLRRYFKFCAVLTLLLVPWGVVSQIEFGSFIPQSGQATRFLSEAYAPHDFPVVSGLSFENGPPKELLVQNVLRSLMLMGTSPVVHIFTRSLEKFLYAAQFEQRAVLLSVGCFLVALLLVVVFMVQRQAKKNLHGKWPSDFNFLYFYSVLMVGAYSFIVFGQIFYSRYYYPIFFFSILLGAFAFDVLLGASGASQSKLRRIVGNLIVVAYCLILPYMSLNRIQTSEYRFLNVVDWIAESTNRDARIGSFNCGAIGYYSDRQVLNLDGKVNRFALAALKQGKIQAYLAEEKIDYVIDHEWILQHMLLDSGEQPAVQFQRVATAEQLGVPGWCAYRVTRSEEVLQEVALPER